jgi:hypothetical protein
MGKVGVIEVLLTRSSLPLSKDSRHRRSILLKSGIISQMMKRL